MFTAKAICKCDEKLEPIIAESSVSLLTSTEEFFKSLELETKLNNYFPDFPRRFVKKSNATKGRFGTTYLIRTNICPNCKGMVFLRYTNFEFYCRNLHSAISTRVFNAQSDIRNETENQEFNFSENTVSRTNANKTMNQLFFDLNNRHLTETLKKLGLPIHEIRKTEYDTFNDIKYIKNRKDISRTTAEFESRTIKEFARRNIKREFGQFSGVSVNIYELTKIMFAESMRLYKMKAFSFEDLDAEIRFVISSLLDRKHSVYIYNEENEDGTKTIPGTNYMYDNSTGAWISRKRQLGLINN